MKKRMFSLFLALTLCLGLLPAAAWAAGIAPDASHLPVQLWKTVNLTLQQRAGLLRNPMILTKRTT